MDFGEQKYIHPVMALTPEEHEAVSFAIDPKQSWNQSEDSIKDWLEKKMQMSVASLLGRYRKATMKIKTEVEVPITPTERHAIAHWLNDAKYMQDRQPASPEQCIEFLNQAVRLQLVMANEFYWDDMQTEKKCKDKQLPLPLIWEEPKKKRKKAS